MHSSSRSSSIPSIVPIVTAIFVIVGLGLWAASDRPKASKEGGIGKPIPPAEAEPARVPQTEPAGVAQPFQGALHGWLVKQSRYRVATLSDCACSEDLGAMLDTYDNTDPYFVVADLNHDGYEDLAAVLFDQTKNPTAALRDTTLEPDVLYKQLWNMGLVVFNGPVQNDMAPAVLLTGIGAPSGALLFYRKAQASLLVGGWEGEGRFLVSTGKSYVLK